MKLHFIKLCEKNRTFLTICFVPHKNDTLRPLTGQHSFCPLPSSVQHHTRFQFVLSKQKTPQAVLRLRCFGTPEGNRTPSLTLRSLAWPMTYGPDVTSHYFSFKTYLWVQGFCDETCTKGRIMTHFLRRPISKFLARISLDAVPFFSHQALLTEQIMEVKQWKIMKSVRCRKRELTP